VVQLVRGDFAARNGAALDGYVKALREAEAFVQNPANFPALLKIAQDTFKINAPGGDKVLEISLRNNLASFRVDVRPQAIQHIAQYMHANGQIDKVVDTSKMLQLR
jgi:NitT/TauT family transport system substrate-binding protein